MAEESNRDVSNLKRRFLGFNVEMIPCKVIMFLTESCMGCIFPFLFLFYVTSGLSPALVGLSSGIGGCFSMIAGPLWGSMVDSITYRKLLFTVLLIFATAFQFVRPWVVMYVAKPEMIRLCHNITVTMDTTLTDHPALMNHNTLVDTTQLKCVMMPHLTNPHQLFYAVVGNDILTAIFYSGLLCYIEGTIINVVFNKQRTPSYGRQKIFAPIGAAVASFVAGVAVDHYQPAHLSRYAAAFYVFLPYAVLSLPVGYILTNQANWEHQAKNAVSLGRHIFSTLKQLDNVMFVLSVLVSGTCYNSIVSFLFLFMHDEWNPSKTVMGLTVVCAMCSELMMYSNTKRIIKFFGGPIPCVVLGIFSYVPRLLLISYCTNPWYILPIQLFHGIGLSLSWTAQAEHTYHIFAKEVTTTALGLMSSLHFVGSAVVTNMAGGILYHLFGPRHFFRGVACLSGVWSFIIFVYFGIRHKMKGYNDNVSYAVYNDKVEGVQGTSGKM